MRPAVGIEPRSPYELRIQGENLFGCRQTLQIGRVCPPGCHPRLDEPRVRPLLQEAGVRRYEPATRSRGVDPILQSLDVDPDAFAELQVVQDLPQVRQ